MGASIRKGKTGGKERGSAPARRPDPDAAARARLEEDIVRRYAATEGSEGTEKLRRCGKRADEDPEMHWRWAGNDGKPVMKNEQAAIDCARQLTVATGKPVHAYRCPRSKSGHYHVSSGRAGTPPQRRSPERKAAR